MRHLKRGKTNTHKQTNKQKKNGEKIGKSRFLKKKLFSKLIVVSFPDIFGQDETTIVAPGGEVILEREETKTSFKLLSNGLMMKAECLE